MDFRVMERMRRRVDTIVEDKATAEALKPWYRFLCKRPLSNADYYETFNRPNVELIDVSTTRGVECMTEKGFVHNGEEFEIDCMIFASGFEVTSDLDRRWGIDAIEGHNGLSIYDHWADGYKTLHGTMSHGFPNQFYVGFYQGGLNATTTQVFKSQGEHIAYIIKAALEREATLVEPSEEAQDDWVRHIRETAIDISEFQRECTPSYFNNEGEAQVNSKGEKTYRWYLGESYGPGWDAFQQLMRDWRDQGDITSEDTSYAGRGRAYKKTMDRAEQAWMASDNEGMNHYEDGTIMVLMNNGAVRSLLRDPDLLEYGWPEDEDDEEFVYEVGPDSPHPLLRKLDR